MGPSIGGADVAFQAVRSKPYLFLIDVHTRRGIKGLGFHLLTPPETRWRIGFKGTFKPAADMG